MIGRGLRNGLPSFSELWLSPVAVFLRPSQFVHRQPPITASTRFDKIAELTRISIFFLVNIIIYALPIASTTPSFVLRQPQSIAVDMASISFSLLVLSGLLFWTFHAGLFVTGNSDGMIQSYQSVVYSTGVYLALGFGLFYASLSRSTPAADVFKKWVQAIGHPTYEVVDQLLNGLSLPFARAIQISESLRSRNVFLPGETWNLIAEPTGSIVAPDTSVRAFGNVDQFVTALALTFIFYYLYAIYLSARLRHDATRLDGLVVVGFVAMTPTLVISVRLLGGEGLMSAVLIWFLIGCFALFGYDTILRRPNNDHA